MNISDKILGLQETLKSDRHQGFCGHCNDQPCSCDTDFEKENRLRLKALSIVSKERDRQINLWGNIYFKNYLHAICVLGEEHGELCEAVNETVNEIKRPDLGGKENMIKEASQVAAVAIKFIQMLLAEEE